MAKKKLNKNLSDLLKKYTINDDVSPKRQLSFGGGSTNSFGDNTDQSFGQGQSTNRMGTEFSGDAGFSSQFGSTEGNTTAADPNVEGQGMSGGDAMGYANAAAGIAGAASSAEPGKEGSNAWNATRESAAGMNPIVGAFHELGEAGKGAGQGMQDGSGSAGDSMGSAIEFQSDPMGRMIANAENEDMSNQQAFASNMSLNTTAGLSDDWFGLADIPGEEEANQRIARESLVNQQVAYGGQLKMAIGGQMPAPGANEKNLTQYNGGGTHEENPNGGIDIGDKAQVEDKETRWEDYIFSDRLKLGKHTYADASKKIEKKYSLRKNDSYDKKAKDKEMKALMAMQEGEKAKMQAKYQKEYQLAFGGGIDGEGDGDKELPATNTLNTVSSDLNQPVLTPKDRQAMLWDDGSGPDNHKETKGGFAGEQTIITGDAPLKKQSQTVGARPDYSQSPYTSLPITGNQRKIMEADWTKYNPDRPTTTGTARGGMDVPDWFVDMNQKNLQGLSKFQLDTNRRAREAGYSGFDEGKPATGQVTSEQLKALYADDPQALEGYYKRLGIDATGRMARGMEVPNLSGNIENTRTGGGTYIDPKGQAWGPKNANQVWYQAPAVTNQGTTQVVGANVAIPEGQQYIAPQAYGGDLSQYAYGGKVQYDGISGPSYLDFAQQGQRPNTVPMEGTGSGNQPYIFSQPNAAPEIYTNPMAAATRDNTPQDFRFYEGAVASEGKPGTVASYVAGEDSQGEDSQGEDSTNWGDLAMLAGQNAGNISNLFNTAENIDLQQAKSTGVDYSRALKNIRDTYDSARNFGAQKIRGGAGSSGAYLANLIAMNTGLSKDKAAALSSMSQAEANQNAQTANRFSMYNTDIANKDILGDAADRAAVASSKDMAKKDISTALAKFTRDKKAEGMQDKYIKNLLSTGEYDYDPKTGKIVHIASKGDQRTQEYHKDPKTGKIIHTATGKPIN